MRKVINSPPLLLSKYNSQDKCFHKLRYAIILFCHTTVDKK